MKMATKKTNEFHSRGIKSQIGYKVANSTHLMEILSGLYSDEIKACIRELSTNAYDAHAEIGKPEVSFKVTLPTKDNRIFKIRDFGPGLSEEKIEKVYTIYGVSDKGDSNDFDGMLGLGSKSPFTYSDMFTTTSYHKGVKYIAVNAINERGRPTFNMLHSEPTDEPDGLEVSFEVKKEHVGEFVEKAAMVYQWFPVMPTINTDTKPRFEKERN
jgi:HSP90 family molecular chaperone